METRLSGNAFQILAVATGKARLPTVESLKGGTTRSLAPEERSERRPDISVTRLSGPSISTSATLTGAAVADTVTAVPNIKLLLTYLLTYLSR